MDIPAIREMLRDKALELRRTGYSIEVDGFDLISSTLTPTGPAYRMVETFRFDKEKEV